MSTQKGIDRICIAVLCLSLLLTLLFMNGERLGIRMISDEDAENYSGSTYFTKNDLDGDWADNAYTSYIQLSDDGGSIDGNGAYFLDGNLIIASAGWYVLSGTLTDGKIIVDATDSSKVWIKLQGVNLSCTEDACLRINQAEKVFLTLSEGTENSFTSGSSYSEEAVSDNAEGVIFSHDDLTINGKGSLTIHAGYKHGIDVNDALTITGGTIQITSPEDGIHVNDSFCFTEASLSLDTGDDAIHSDNEVYIEGGSILVSSCYEGIEATTIDITGGEISIYSEDDGINANGDNEEAESYIRISGGNLTIENEKGQDADGLDSNGNIYIEGGNIRISLPGNGSNNAIDYGSESGGECIVTGGVLLAFGGSAMAEEFSEKSTQGSVLYNFSSTVEAESVFRILDKNGEELIAYEPASAYSSVSFSMPEIRVGESYTLCYGEESAALTVESVSTKAGASGGMGGMPHGAMGERVPGERPSGKRVPGERPSGKRSPEGMEERPPHEDRKEDS